MQVLDIPGATVYSRVYVGFHCGAVILCWDHSSEMVGEILLSGVEAAVHSFYHCSLNHNY